MNAELWQKADQIFQDVVELAPAHRAAFLDEACASDQQVRDEVVSLLEADSFDWEFIETSALESAAALLAEEQPQLSPGQTVAHYEIIDLIGQGGMGEVYLAKDPTLNRYVALKLLPFEYTRNKDRLTRFQREAQAASALNHPNILTIHQLGLVEGQHFIATEFIEGETVRAHIDRGPIALNAAIDLMLQIASALAAAHRAGIVHRDIKPENIMLRPDGYVKVLDFGLAKLADSRPVGGAPVFDSAAEPNDISSGLFMGTIRYMSPEQASGLHVDASSDIFSLGVVMFEMLTCARPFAAKDNAKLVQSILEDEPPPLREYLDDIPERLEAIIAKCLAKEKNKRYKSADELFADLKLLKDELGAKAPATSESRSIISQLRRPSFAIMLIVFLLAVLPIGYVAYSYLSKAPAESNFASSATEKGMWKTVASLSSARSHAAPAVLNGTLYVSGGMNVCEHYATLESYDPRTDTWAERKPMQSPRGAHAVGVLDGLLYAVGGETDCGYQAEIATVEAYDPVTDEWSQKPPLPTKRVTHTVAVAKGKLYAIGGSADGMRLALNTEFDPKTNRWTNRSPMPTPRFAAAAVVVNEIIYVIGGSGGETTVEAYDPVTDKWTAKAPMPTPRQSHSASSINGRIYVFGGFNSGPVEVYDPATDTWSVGGQMNAPRAQLGSATSKGSIYLLGGFDGVEYSSSVVAFTPEGSLSRKNTLCPDSDGWTKKPPMPTARSMTAAAEINGVIYVVGGQYVGAHAQPVVRLSDLVYLTDNEAYDPVTETWSKKASMPTARMVRGTNNAVVDKKLYVIGGAPHYVCTDANEVYDPETDSWSKRAPMPTARCHVTVIAVNGLIYAIGGNVNNSFTSTVEIYDPSTDTWETTASLPTPRQEVVAGVIDGKIYVAGGSGQFGTLDNLDVYDPATRTWTAKAPMSTVRVGSAAVIVDGHLVVLGGYSYEKRLATVEAYDPQTDTWSQLPSMPTERAYLSAFAMNDTIYAIGGLDDAEQHHSLSTHEALKLMPCGE